jgi:hypothetical protein
VSFSLRRRYETSLYFSNFRFQFSDKKFNLLTHSYTPRKRPLDEHINDEDVREDLKAVGSDSNEAQSTTEPETGPSAVGSAVAATVELTAGMDVDLSDELADMEAPDVNGLETEIFVGESENC